MFTSYGESVVPVYHEPHHRQILLFALMLATSARGETAEALRGAEQSSLQSYAATHAECSEWDDGCATCRRGASVHCSTPGIACEPHDIVCKAP